MVLRFTKYDGILGPEHKRNAHLEQSQLLPWEHEANQIHLQIEYYIGWKVWLQLGKNQSQTLDQQETDHLISFAHFYGHDLQNVENYNPSVHCFLAV